MGPGRVGGQVGWVGCDAVEVPPQAAVICSLLLRPPAHRCRLHTRVRRSCRAVLLAPLLHVPALWQALRVHPALLVRLLLLSCDRPAGGAKCMPMGTRSMGGWQLVLAREG
jgi:hypothetical protein